MLKDSRTTIYLNPILDKRFREACNKKFGDAQGKLKKGYLIAITDFCDKVLDTELDQVESPDLLAEKLKQAKTSVNLDHDELQALVEKTESIVEVDQEGTISFNDKLSSKDIEAKAKKLAEERKKEQQDSNEHQILT